MKLTFGSKGKKSIWCRAVDSTGQTINFLLTAKRNQAAAKRFFRKVFRSPANPIPRVINVDKNGAYPAEVKPSKRKDSCLAEFAYDNVSS